MTRLIANGLVLACLLLVGLTNATAASHPPLTTDKGVVASDHESASEVGAEVLEKGGNAIDAAAATALALGVVNPSSSGIGGGGFAVIYVASEKKLYTLDFREVGPAAISPKSFVVNGKLDPMLSRVGGLAVGVPGEVAGLEEMWKRNGALPWKDVVEPARKMADEGYLASWFFARAASIVVERLGPDHLLSKWLSPGGKVIRKGMLLKRSKLAWTLGLIATKGSAGFYSGPVAADIVASTRKAGGVLSEADLGSYQVVEREPLIGAFKGMKVATMPLPSSGGLLLLEMLGILDAGNFDLAALGSGSSAAQHLVGEVLKHGFADRARLLGDDAGAAEIAKRFLEPTRLADLASRISLDATKAHDSYGSKELGSAGGTPDDQGTSHLCVVDKDGNAVALTTTVNGYFGSGVVTDRSGIVLNNEIDDFSLKAGVPNMFGLVQSDANLVGPGKRPLSSMTPTLIIDDEGVVGCFGGSGGPRIISNTFQAILNAFVHGQDISRALASPRVHHQWLPNKLDVEDDSAADVVESLRKRGHEVSLNSYITAVQAIIRRDGLLQAASDPRKAGRPAAERPASDR